MNITYTNSITVDEFNYIRSSIGFRQWQPEQVQGEIDGSTLIIAAYENLYKSLGFVDSTVELRGTPMHKCLTNQIWLTDQMYKQMEFSEK